MQFLRMAVLAPLAAGLAWLGRRGTGAVAAIVLISIAIPSIGAILKPFVSEAVFVLLVISFLRMDAAGFRACLRRPSLVLAATAWTSLAVPALFGASCLASGVNIQSPDLFLALMLQAVASPMMASPALAALMGLDSTLVLATLVTSTALVPITAPLFAQAFMGSALTLSPPALGLQLFTILAGSAFIAFVLRRVAGLDAIERQRERINGVNILILFVFAAAVMESIPDHFLADPTNTIRVGGIAFVAFIAVFVLTVAVFSFAGRERALALGFMASQRNMGLMLAATAGALPDLTWLYFALSQFPIYLSPRLLEPLARRILRAPQLPPKRTGSTRKASSS